MFMQKYSDILFYIATFGVKILAGVVIMELDFQKIGQRIRHQREFLGYTREQFAELIDKTPKFCSDIELGIKGMSLQTLNQIGNKLKLSSDYILYGISFSKENNQINKMLLSCPENKRKYAEQILKNFLQALD